MHKVTLIRNLFIFFISIGVIVLSREYTDHANLLPTFCAISIIVFSILDYIQNSKFNNLKIQKIYINFRPYVILFISIIYVILIILLGFFVSTIIYFIISSFYLGVKNYKHIFVTLIILIPLMYAFFVIFLKTSLPKGFLI